jgi:dethiobiotin synthetase
MTRGVFITGTDTGVGKTRVGTLNHTLLTIEAVRMRGLALAGVVLNQPVPQADPKMSNAEDLERWLQMPVLRLSHGSGSRLEAWQQEAASLSRLADAWLAGISLNRPCR